MKRFLILALVFGLTLFSTKALAAVDINYLFLVDNPSSGRATVRMQITGISGNTFDLQEHSYHGHYFNLISISANSPNGDNLSIEYRPGAGESGMNGNTDVWSVSCNGNTSITVEYVVQPGVMEQDGDEYRGYIGSDFALLCGEHVFLIPYPESDSYGKVRVKYQLPESWSVITPWKLTEEGYDPFVTVDGTAALTLDGLCISNFGLGKMEIRTEMAGDTEVRVAAYDLWPQWVKDTLFTNAFNMTKYLTSVWGRSVGSSYVAIFCPDAPDGVGIYGGEWSTSQGYSISYSDQDVTGKWTMFVHQLVHRWNGWAWGIRPQNSTAWFGEGTAVFYEWKTMDVLGLKDGNPVTTAERISQLFREYIDNYVNQGKDKSLATVGFNDTFLRYRKSAMVCFLMAKEIVKLTGGAKTFDDLLRALYDRYGHNVGSLSDAGFKEVLGQITGTDWTGFYNSYVSGTETLPMEWAQEDDDGDGILNANEIALNTNPWSAN